MITPPHAPDQLLGSQIMTLSETARYLKIAEKSLRRMLGRNDIPAVKVGNQWRFVRSVVDQWLHMHMQTAASQQAGAAGCLNMPFTELIRPGCVLPRIVPGSVPFVLSQLVAPLVDHGLVADTATLLQLLCWRERVVSTAIADGCAFPHPRDPEKLPVRTPCAVLGVAPDGTDFHAVDGRPTHVFLLLCAGSERVHLQLMARAALLMRQPEVVPRLRAAGDEATTRGVLAEAEALLRADGPPADASALIAEAAK